MDKRQYFACFNYRHKDMELIKRLQHEYKYYELTATLFEERKDLQKKTFKNLSDLVLREEDGLTVNIHDTFKRFSLRT